jgi:ribosomal protein S12 methylthiotransferase accessory factor YcaO
VKPVKQKVVKMPPDFWDELQGLAARQGITLHNAIRAALVEYVARKHA